MNNPKDSNDFWVFGYGSLMWNPGFDHVDVHRARMRGVHRAPCIYSWVHRGTKQRPGIVLGLDRGGTCIGKAFRVTAQNREATLDYLRARELVTNVYLETTRTAELDNGQRVSTVTYIVDRDHEQYAGRLDHDALLRQIAGAVGKSGPNEAYILDTADHLEEMGINDGLMRRVAQELRNNFRT